MSWIFTTTAQYCSHVKNPLHWDTFWSQPNNATIVTKSLKCDYDNKVLKKLAAILDIVKDANNNKNIIKI